MTEQSQPLPRARLAGRCGMVAALALLVLSALPAVAQVSPGPPGGAELVIGTKEAPPFAMRGRDGQWSGIAIDLWRRIAQQLHLRYRLQGASLDELIEGTAHGRLDGAVAALTVTAARDRLVDFSQPFYTTGLGIAVPADPAMTWWPIVRSIFSLGFLRALAALVAVALAVGSLVWALERRHNVHFGGHPTRGLGHGMWWSALVMTQSGAAAGERVPATLAGRVVAVVWMTASVIVIAAFTAALASQLTTTRLHGLVHGQEDLRFVRTGAIAGTATLGYLAQERIGYRTFATPEAGLRALRAGRIDALVYDRPLLTWLVRSQFSGTLEVLGSTFDPQTYAIALPAGSKLREPINRVLLDDLESDWWRELLFQYLGTT